MAYARTSRHYLSYTAGMMEHDNSERIITGAIIGIVILCAIIYMALTTF
jgi:hypothetical protein